MTRQTKQKKAKHKQTKPSGSGKARASSSASSSASHSSKNGSLVQPEGSGARRAGPASDSEARTGGYTRAFEPGLYLVATPIGNARDITLRALDLLAAADVIACEDTRVTAKLLAIHGIKAPLLAYHDHNARSQGPKIIERLKVGEIVALVSDAGTPLISDPGFGLVRAALDADLTVTALPGASSVLTGLLLSSLPAERFFFQGFLPPKSAARKTALGELVGVPATLVFLESPKRLAATLADMADVLGAREGAVLRELTKKFEEARRAPLPDLAHHYKEAGAPKGEVVVVVGPPAKDAATPDAEALDALIETALADMSVRDAAAHVATETGVRKKDVYDRALMLAKKDGGA